MAKRRNLNADQPQIDASYEQDVSRLENVTGQVSDYSFTDEAPDMRRPKTSYLPATRPNRVRQMSQAESEALQAMTQAAMNQTQQVIPLPEVPQNTHTGHARQVDSAESVGRASARYGHIIGAWAGAFLTAILFFAWLTVGGDGSLYVTVEGMIITLCMVVALLINRKQGLDHSPAGVARLEIKQQQQNVRHATDTHGAIELERIRAAERTAKFAIRAQVHLMKERSKKGLIEDGRQDED